MLYQGVSLSTQVASLWESFALRHPGSRYEILTHQSGYKAYWTLQPDGLLLGLCYPMLKDCGEFSPGSGVDWEQDLWESGEFSPIPHLCLEGVWPYLFNENVPVDIDTIDTVADDSKLDLALTHTAIHWSKGLSGSSN